MKRSVQWSRAALDDFKAQISYIAADNPRPPFAWRSVSATR